MKKKRTYIVVLTLLLLSLFYLQYGRNIIVYNSNTFTSTNYEEVELNIIANRLYIGDKTSFSKKILQRCRENSFHEIRLSNTDPDKFTINVYTNKHCLQDERTSFKIIYYTHTSKLIIEK